MLFLQRLALADLKLDAIIRSTGFKLARQRKHKVYKHAELRKTLTLPSTPKNIGKDVP